MKRNHWCKHETIYTLDENKKLSRKIPTVNIHAAIRLWNLRFGIIRLTYTHKVQKCHLCLFYLTKIRANSLIGLYSDKCWAEPIGLFVNKLAFLGSELFLFRVWKTRRKKLFHLKRINRHLIFHHMLVTRCSQQQDYKPCEIVPLLFPLAPQHLTQSLILCFPVFKKSNGRPYYGSCLAFPRGKQAA